MSASLQFDGMPSFVLSFNHPSSATAGDLGLATPADAIEGTATDLLMSPSTTADAIEGYPWLSAVGNTPRTLPMRASAQVIEAADFGVEAGADPVVTTAALKNALAAIAGLGSGRILQLPYGRINITATDVAAGEGISFLLGADLSHLHVRGCGRGATTLAAVSNRVEMFAQVGAIGAEFSDLTFESPSILQNTPKPGGVVPIGGGVAEWGNTANVAVRQYYGAGTTFRRVGFRNWCVCCSYFGNYLNNTVIDGTVHMEDVVANNYVQGLLCNEPSIINFINWELHDGVDSINADATIDPGHGLYITDRGGAHPEHVMVSNVKGTDSRSSIVKVRKGQTVVVQGVTAWNCGRGVEINNCMRATVSNISIKLADNNPDSGRSAMNFDNTGIHEVSNVFIDMRGTVGWGVRIRPDPTGIPMPEFPMQYGRFNDITIMHDFNPGIGAAPIAAADANDLTISNFRLINVGPAGNNRWPIQLVNCQRARIYWPQHSSLNLAADAHTLVSLDPGCVDCHVIYSESGVDVPTTSLTIADNGTNTKITRAAAGVTDPVTFPHGSAAATGIAFTGDPASGMFMTMTSNWSLAAAGIEQMRIVGDKVVFCTQVRPLLDGATNLGGGGFGWKMLSLTPLAAPPSPSPLVGYLAISDGTWGASGAGLYRWSGSAWVFVG